MHTPPLADLIGHFCMMEESENTESKTCKGRPSCLSDDDSCLLLSSFIVLYVELHHLLTIAHAEHMHKQYMWYFGLANIINNLRLTIENSRNFTKFSGSSLQHNSASFLHHSTATFSALPKECKTGYK